MNMAAVITDTKFMQSSPIDEEEKETNYLQENAIEKPNQRHELDRTSNADGCAKREVHQFYFIKFWPEEDQKVKSKIEEAEKLMEKINKETSPITKEYKKRMTDRCNIVHQYLHIKNRGNAIKHMLAQNTENKVHLQVAIRKLKLDKSAYERRDINSRSSAELLNSFAFQMVHRTNNLATERKLLREIKERLSMNESQQRQPIDSYSSAKNSRDFIRRSYSYDLGYSNLDKDRKKRVLKVIQELDQAEEAACTNANLKGKSWNPLRSSKAMEERIRVINKILEELEKQLSEIRAEIKLVEKDLDIADKEASPLTRQYKDVVVQRKNDVYRNILILKQQDMANDRYARYVSVMSNAKELARKKDVKALEELSRRQVDLYMSKWNRNYYFRRYYEKSVLASLEKRQLTKDGRMRNIN